MWDSGKDFDAKKHCDEHAAKLSLAVAFMANAKVLKVKPNEACTQIIVRMRLGKKIVRVEVDADSPYGAKEKLLDKVLRKFGVPRPWSSWTWRTKIAQDVIKEMERRGADGFKLAEDATRRFCDGAAFEKKRADHKIRGELNRALASLRNARAAGATPRQMRKLISQIMAEEAVAEVQSA